jgi:serine/threonine protein kinase
MNRVTPPHGRPAGRLFAKLRVRHDGQSLLKPGFRIGHYVIHETLGSGGSGVVYRAEDDQLDRFVALKVVSADPRLGRGWREHALREARIAMTVRHPALPIVFDVGETSDAIWIAAELVDGESLADRAESLPPVVVAVILSEIASALDALHAACILHRDVKPANIVFSVSGRLRLVDFGVAGSTADGSHGVSGTPRYAPPERWRGHTEGPCSDVYSLACVSYEMLTRRSIFEESADTASLMMAHLAAIPAPLPSVLAPMQSVLDRGLAKRPGDRYQTASDFTNELVESAKAVKWRSQTDHPTQTPGQHAHDMADSRYETMFFAALLLVPGRPEAYKLARRLSQAEPHGEWGMASTATYDGHTHEVIGTLVSLRAHLPYGEALVGVGGARDALHRFVVRLLRALDGDQILVRARFHINDADLHDHPPWSDVGQWVVNHRDVPEDWAYQTLEGLLKDGYGESSAVSSAG